MVVVRPKLLLGAGAAALVLYGLSSVGQIGQVLHNGAEQEAAELRRQLARAREELLAARVEAERLGQKPDWLAAGSEPPPPSTLEGVYFLNGTGVRLRGGDIVAAESFGPLFDRCRYRSEGRAAGEASVRVASSGGGCPSPQVWRRRGDGHLQAYEADGQTPLPGEVWHLEDGLPTLTVLVPTFDRPTSLLRSLQSLRTAAGTPGRRPRRRAIHLIITVDRASPTDKERWDGAEYAAARNETIRIAEQFGWPFGRKEVRVMYKNMGLAMQWLQNMPFAGDAVDRDELFMVLEDDIELSPLFFGALDLIQQHFGVAHDERVASVCLYPLPQPSPGTFYWYRKWGGYICSWGPVWRAASARRFSSWLRESYGRIKPYTGSKVFNRWIDQGRELQSTWTGRFMEDTGLWSGTLSFGKDADGSDLYRYMIVNHHEKGVNEKNKINNQWEKKLAQLPHAGLLPSDEEWRRLPRVVPDG